MIKGYLTRAGYFGLMPDGVYHLYPTETEYLEAYEETQKKEEDNEED